MAAVTDSADGNTPVDTKDDSSRMVAPVPTVWKNVTPLLPQRIVLVSSRSRKSKRFDENDVAIGDQDHVNKDEAGP